MVANGCIFIETTGRVPNIDLTSHVNETWRGNKSLINKQADPREP
jgi:hypothetical protein